MENLFKILPYACAIVGGWSVLNGILHDIFVLRKHKGGYNRDLLRLLMDGHILITCGVMQIIAGKLLQRDNVFGFYVGAVACISLLIYCFMIWPFLKSVVTMALQIGLLLLLCMPNL